jgi:hypothetical protein
VFKKIVRLTLDMDVALMAQSDFDSQTWNFDVEIRTTLLINPFFDARCDESWQTGRRHVDPPPLVLLGVCATKSVHHGNVALGLLLDCDHDFPKFLRKTDFVEGLAANFYGQRIFLLQGVTIRA